MTSELEAFRGGLIVGAVCGWVHTYHPKKIGLVTEALLAEGAAEDKLSREQLIELVMRVTGDKFNDLQLFGLWAHCDAARLAFEAIGGPT